MARYVRFPPRMESVSHQPGQHCLHQGNGCLEVLHHPDNGKPFLEVEHRQLQSRLTSWITAFNAGRSKTIFKRTQWCGSYSILCISCMDIFRCSSTVWISFINTMFPNPHSLLRSTKVSQLQILSTRANQTFWIIFPHTPVKCRFNQIFIFPNCQFFFKTCLSFSKTTHGVAYVHVCSIDEHSFQKAFFLKSKRPLCYLR